LLASAGQMMNRLIRRDAIDRIAFSQREIQIAGRLMAMVRGYWNGAVFTSAPSEGATFATSIRLDGAAGKIHLSNTEIADMDEQPPGSTAML
jgi:hypothetical protein